MTANDDHETTAVANSGTEELYHTNLLRLQVKQLLSESILPLSSQTGFLDDEVKWTKDVHDYIEALQKTISSMDAAILSPDDVLLKKRGSDGNHNGGDELTTSSFKEKSFLIQLHSDKAMKHLNRNSSSAPGDNKKGNSNDEWKIHFPGGDCLQMASVNSYAANGAGMTTTVANANVIPTIDVAVMMPAKSRNDVDDDNDATNDGGMIGGKDYLNGRYFDVRLLLFFQVIPYFIFPTLICQKANLY